jgi:hypothetical protein
MAGPPLAAVAADHGAARGWERDSTGDFGWLETKTFGGLASWSKVKKLLDRCVHLVIDTDKEPKVSQRMKGCQTLDS